MRAAMARAALEGRDHVLPDDVKELAGSVLAHRLVLSATATAETEGGEIVAAALGRVAAL